MKNRVIWYIHGANSSPTSFTRIKERLPIHDFENIEYSTLTPLQDTIQAITHKAKSQNRPIDIIAHSLGGVIAVALAQEKARVHKIVTIGSPFGGSRMANLLKWFMTDQLFSDIATSSPIIRRLCERKIGVPVLSIVATSGGVAMMREENDGVVTVSSQLTLSEPRYIKVNYNHFEALLADETVSHIKGFLF